jgi:hypothetical protein
MNQPNPVSLAGLLAIALRQAPARHLEPFIYERTFSFAAGAAVGTTLTQSVTISADADFCCTRITATCRVANGRHASADSDDGTEEIGGVPDVPVTVELTESGQQKVLQDQPVDALAAYGHPYRDLPRPKLFSRNSQVAIKLAMLKASAGGSGGFTVRVQLHGWKDYASGGR